MRIQLLACDRKASTHKEEVLITKTRGTIYKQLSIEALSMRTPFCDRQTSTHKERTLFTKEMENYLQLRLLTCFTFATKVSIDDSC